MWLGYFEHINESTHALVFVYQARTVATSVYVLLYLCIRMRQGMKSTWPLVSQALTTLLIGFLLTKYIDKSYILIITLFFEMLNNLI